MFSQSLLENYRMNEKDFTRKRKQSFVSTLVFMMNLLRKSLVIEIHNFVTILNSDTRNISQQFFTKSAFTQNRKKIKPEVFDELSKSLTEEFYSDNEENVKLWKGFRLLAVDGSLVNLPNTKEVRDYYGVSINQKGSGSPQGRISLLYDVLNGFVIDANLSPLSIGERTLSYEHAKLSKSNDLVIYDRGYPSFNLAYEHTKANSDFVMRVRINFSSMTKEFYKSNKISDIVEMTPSLEKEGNYGKDDKIKVRLVRVELDSDEDEILITSLLSDELYPDMIFKDLYYKRWNIETYYNELKNNLRIGIFTGYTKHAIQQDFSVAIFISNLHNLIVRDVDEELDNQGIKEKYKHKVNRNTTYGFMKNKVISIFFSDRKPSEITEELRELFLSNTIPIRPNRKFKREVAKHKGRTRSQNPTNHKDAI